VAVVVLEEVLVEEFNAFVGFGAFEGSRGLCLDSRVRIQSSRYRN